MHVPKVYASIAPNQKMTFWSEREVADRSRLLTEVENTGDARLSIPNPYVPALFLSFPMAAGNATSRPGCDGVALTIVLRAWKVERSPSIQGNDQRRLVCRIRCSGACHNEAVFRIDSQLK
jgi:hypothetical protein